jgi:hypothetical protein
LNSTSYLGFRTEINKQITTKSRKLLRSCLFGSFQSLHNNSSIKRWLSRRIAFRIISKIKIINIINYYSYYSY